MNNNDIFLDFWKNFKWPEPTELYFRLYYDDQGRAICYSREEMDGNYIDITPEQFALADMNVKVSNGVLIPKAPPPPPKLIPSDQGVTCHPWDVSIVVSPEQKHQAWKMTNHENS